MFLPSLSFPTKPICLCSFPCSTSLAHRWGAVPTQKMRQWVPPARLLYRVAERNLSLGRFSLAIHPAPLRAEAADFTKPTERPGPHTDRCAATLGSGLRLSAQAVSTELSFLPAPPAPGGHADCSASLARPQAGSSCACPKAGRTSRFCPAVGGGSPGPAGRGQVQASMLLTLGSPPPPH